MPGQSITVADVYLEDKSKYPIIVPHKADWSFTVDDPIVRAYAVFTVGDCPYGWIVTRKRVAAVHTFCRPHFYERMSRHRQKKMRRRDRYSHQEMSFHRFRLEEGIGGRLLLPSELRVADGHLLLPSEGCVSIDLKNHYRVRQRIVKDYPHLPHLPYLPPL